MPDTGTARQGQDQRQIQRQGQRQRQKSAAATAHVSTTSLRDRMEQTPRHGSHLVEELNSDNGLLLIDNTCVGQQAKERVHLRVVHALFPRR